VAFARCNVETEASSHVARARARACRSGFRKPQPHYPKYSSARSGHMQFSSGFCQLDVGQRKRETARSKTREEEAAGRRRRGERRSVILSRLPVISRFYPAVSRAQLVLLENVVAVRRFPLPASPSSRKRRRSYRRDSYGTRSSSLAGFYRPGDLPVYLHTYVRTCVRVEPTELIAGLDSRLFIY